jgi:hypothetical protein
VDIEKIVKLCTVENMSLAELQEDPKFNKIPQNMILDYINGSIRIAREKAAKIKCENKDISLADICKANGVTINISDKDYSVMNVRYRAEIYYEKKIINIMKFSIIQMYEQLKKLKFSENEYPVSADSITDIHIAHELYHLIENISGEETGSLLPRVTNIKIGKFKKESEVVSTSEIAAHVFCMEVLKLPFHPKLLDYMYLVGSGEVTEEKLLNFLNKLQERNDTIRANYSNMGE